MKNVYDDFFLKKHFKKLITPYPFQHEFQTTGKLEDEVSKMKELLEEKDDQLEKTRKDSMKQQLLLEARIKELEAVSNSPTSAVAPPPPPPMAPPPPPPPPPMAPPPPPFNNTTLPTSSNSGRSSLSDLLKDGIQLKSVDNQDMKKTSGREDLINEIKKGVKLKSRKTDGHRKPVEDEGSLISELEKALKKMRVVKGFEIED